MTFPSSPAGREELTLHVRGRLAFFLHPRAGSTSLEAALEGVGFRMVGSRHSGPREHATAGLTCFAVVRDPWDALASWWYYMTADQRADRITVPWLEAHVRGHATYFGARTMWPMADFLPLDRVLRFERLQEELRRVLPEVDGLPHLNASAARRAQPYASLFTLDAASWVAARFPSDLTRYGYIFAGSS